MHITPISADVRIVSHGSPSCAITRENHNGSGLDSYIVPACSCGWKGRAEYAHNDYQFTNLREQEAAHMKGHQ